LLASDFPSENPRTQNRTILILDRYRQAKKTLRQSMISKNKEYGF
jgi:hypothetical protein